MQYFRLVIYILSISIFTTCTPSKYVTLSANNIELMNREYAEIHDSNSGIISIKADEGGGMAIVKSVSFETGTIEFDQRGENNPGKSFVGLAFNIQDKDTYESIYFRPFNFLSKEPIRRSHSIQYVYHPEHTWSLLRKEHKGVYEAEYFNPPNPDEWFSVKIEISESHVIVLDPKSKKTLLNVRRLGNRKSDKIGFWTGNNSKGDFRNLRIVKK